MNEALIETPDEETSSESYANRFSGETGAWMLRIQEQATLKLLSFCKGNTILDIGGGHGQTLLPLINNGYEVTVYGSTAACANRIGPYINSSKAKFASGNLTRLPFLDSSFDFAISYRLLSHLIQWKTCVAEMCRVARHGIIVDYPVIGSFNIFSFVLFPLKRKIEKNTRTFRLFSHRQIMSEFRSHGFNSESSISQFYWPMALHRLLKNVNVSKSLEGIAHSFRLDSAFGSPVIHLFTRNSG